MFKIYLFISIVTIALFCSYYNISGQVIVNNGAKLFLNKGIFVRIENIALKNKQLGTIIVRDSSSLSVNGGMENVSGDVTIKDNSIFTVKDDLKNSDGFDNINNSQTTVKKNVLNSGAIINEGIIEIGE